MQINLKTIERHAMGKLRLIDSKNSGSTDALKNFLRIETQRLRRKSRFAGKEVSSARSLIIDILIRQLAQKLLSEKVGDQFAIVALGGYGRRELSPYSDIDLLFLHRNSKDSYRAAEYSEIILHKLWDIGLTVGHSLRSLNKCISIANEDIVSRNSMVDARLIWGNEELTFDLHRRLDKEVFEKQKTKLLYELLDERKSRYTKFGDAVCILEPNVKETAGGLRDLHSMMWMFRIAYGVSDLSQAVTEEIISKSDAGKIETDYEFVMKVRNELHFTTGRINDRLTSDQHTVIAEYQGYEATQSLMSSEIFMRDYYMHARRLHLLCDSYIRRIETDRKRKWFYGLQKTTDVNGFIIRDGILDLGTINKDQASDESSNALAPNLMMLAFGYAQATGAGLSASIRNAISAGLNSIDGNFIKDTENGAVFLRMLGARERVSHVLRLMHDTNFLGRFLPEFGRITCLVQHDLYHKFTVDEHTLRAIRFLDFSDKTPGKEKEQARYRKLYADLTDPAILHLGILMHDIGKGLGGGHTEKGIKIAEEVCFRLGATFEFTDGVLFLVREHLKMSHISQRRDLSDESVIESFAEQVGTVDKLKMLTLLTYADINAVGPGIWSEWKDTLLWELYFKAQVLLTAPYQEERDPESLLLPLMTHIGGMLANEVKHDEIQRHFDLLPDDYARVTPPTTIIEHIRLAYSGNSRPAKTSWRIDVQARCTDMHLCAGNRRGLFALVAGVLTTQGINILSANLNTRSDGLAIDSFKIRDFAGQTITDPARWNRIDDAINRALTGDLDVGSGVATRLKAQKESTWKKKRRSSVRTTINWDNLASNKSTILEVRTSDRLGLAFKIAGAITSLYLDIVFAKVATEKNLALDIFYITDSDGKKLDDSRLPEIEEVIHRALGE